MLKLGQADEVGKAGKGGPDGAFTGKE